MLCSSTWNHLKCMQTNELSLILKCYQQNVFTNHLYLIYVRMLYIDLRPGQTCHSKDAEVAYSIGVGELGRQYGTGLKSNGTVTNWCTGREWPVNCMMAIPKTVEVHIPMASYGEILSGRELLYNSMHRKFNQLESRYGRESQHPAEGALRPPIDSLETRPVGVKMQ